MQLQTTFEELNDVIRQKSPVKGLTLSYRSADTATVSFALNVLGLLSPPVSADIRIVSIEGSRLTAELDAGNVGGFFLDKARNLLIEKAPAGLIEHFDGRQAVLNLEVIPQLKTVFDRIAVSGLSFTENAVCLDASLKTNSEA